MLVTDRGLLLPMVTMFTILQALAEECPGPFETTAGFGRWLDGAAWDAARVRRTDPAAFLEQCGEEGRRFERDTSSIRLYD